ncbi:MAG: hypothetical protein JST77_17350 [Acidobacteria bacterium]|nr:hypothetical protein [Acidobacteriota bacterium]
MFAEQKRYPYIENKRCHTSRLATRGHSFSHIHFRDKAFLGISVAPRVRVHSADLYVESSGDYEVLKDYVHGEQSGKKAKK